MPITTSPETTLETEARFQSLGKALWTQLPQESPARGDREYTAARLLARRPIVVFRIGSMDV